MTETQAHLSCEQCKKRKTKCDKIFPRCSACKVANITCHPVQRARLPRGRTGIVKHKSNALADKVARLENLVERLQFQIQTNNNDTDPHGRTESLSNMAPVQSPSKVENLVARDFWNELTKEVISLRETLESTGEDNNQADPMQQRYKSTTLSTLLFNRTPELSGHDVPQVSKSVEETLVQIYYDRVDILFKVTYWPIVLKNLRETGSTVIEKAICFTAASTLSEQDCAEHEFGSKDVLINRCRRDVETSLSLTSFLTEPSFLTLQAFTIYLIGLRTCGDGATVWSLLALAVRLATALNLGSETNNTLSVIDIEQRRRLWFGIGLLDSMAAFGRASTPVLSYQDLKHPPLNINDSEVGVRTMSNQPFTEMSISCLTHQAMLCQRKLCDPSYVTTWQTRIEIVAEFETFVERTYTNLEFSTNPLERYAALAAKGMLTDMQLILRRPLYRNSDASQQDPPPPSDNFDVLGAAVFVIERGLSKQQPPEFARWSWFSWPRWYALAIVLVELCKSPVRHQTQNRWSAEQERAYTIAQKSFAEYAQSAADVSSGMVWTPIARLKKRVQTLHLATGSSRSDKTVTAHPVRSVQITEATIDARWHPDLRVSNTEPDTSFGPDVIMDFQWDSFLHDLSRQSDQATATGTESDQAATSTSSWTLMPYLPVFPHQGLNKESDVGGERSSSFGVPEMWS